MEQCVFAPPPVRRKPAKKMQDRLRHLESLVMDLASRAGHNGSVEAVEMVADVSVNDHVTPESGGAAHPHDAQFSRCPNTGKTVRLY